MQALEGIGKTDRQRIAAVLRGSKGTVSVGETARILSVGASDAAKMLSRLAKKGWMSRVRQGLYVPVPLESDTAEYFDLTEQMFSRVMVMTVLRPRDKQPVFRDQAFWIRTVPESAMVGLKPVWQGQVKVMVSDPARTLADMLEPGRRRGHPDGKGYAGQVA